MNQKKKKCASRDTFSRPGKKNVDTSKGNKNVSYHNDNGAEVEQEKYKQIFSKSMVRLIVSIVKWREEFVRRDKRISILLESRENRCRKEGL